MQEKPQEIVKREQDTASLAEALEATALTKDNYTVIMGVLVSCKANLKYLQAQRDEALNPAKETVSRIKGYFGDALSRLERCEEVIKDKAVTYLGAQAAARITAANAGQQVPPPPPAVEGVSIREGWDLKVISPELLTPDLLQPNMAAIKARMKEMMTEDGPYAIPGVKFFRKQTIAVTPPKG